MSNVFSGFGSNKYVNGTKQFLESNSIVAKFAFLILILIIFILALRLGTSLLSYLFAPKQNPILINGMIDAKQMTIIPQDPSVSGAIPVLRSQNQRDGLTFTWSVWTFIDDLQYRQGEYRHIFHRGDDLIQTTGKRAGLSEPTNAPGLYIMPNSNKLVVIMNTFEVINEEIIINDIPLNKWINVIIRVDENHQLDVYINGRLVKRHILKGVPRQNYGDVYLSMNGGYSGYTSCLRYFDSPIGTNKIQSIVSEGPCTNLLSKDNMSAKSNFPPYFSLRWYFAGDKNMYYP